MEIKMKKIFIATVLFFFCLSSAHAFLAKTKEINPEEYPFLLLAEDLQIYNLKLDLSGSAEKARLKKWINGVYDIYLLSSDSRSCTQRLRWSCFNNVNLARLRRFAP